MDRRTIPITIAKFFYGPSITHKNYHLAKKCIKIGLDESSNFGI
jgi:hypothetical protein